MRSMEDWNRLGTRVKPLNLMVAPEIFTVQQRIYLPNGRVILEGTKYFTHPVALKMVADGYVYEGWRLPTLAEAQIIARNYGSAKRGLLVLGLDGYVCPGDMAFYDYRPKYDSGLVVRKGKIGQYWTCDKDSDLYPYVITNFGLTVRAGATIYLSYGLPMILVKNI